VHPSGHYVYVTTPTGVYGFAVGSNGSLKIVSGSPFSTSFGSLALAINPSGKFLYVSTSSLIGNTTYSAVDAFSINPVDGTLTPIAGTPFIGPASIKCDAAADDMDFDPTGQYLILPDHCAGVNIFRLNSSVGTLAQVSGSPFALPSPNMEANSVAIDPLGRYVYIEVGCFPNCSSSALTYKLNSQSGAVTYVQAKTTQNESWLRADPSGKFVYDFGVNGNPAPQIRGWSVNQSTGALANVPGSPFPYKSTWLAITP
jgi:6-phosphogluconolactonase (cycloisomerase 2 family)